jgi:hypothetical protein
LEQGKNRKDRLPIRIVEETDEPEQTDDYPFIVIGEHRIGKLELQGLKF